MSSAATSPVAPRHGGFQRFWRALRQLFLEVMGAVFAICGIVWLQAAFRSWSRDVAHWLIGLVIVVAGIFFFYAVSSFRRARKL